MSLDADQALDRQLALMTALAALAHYAKHLDQLRRVRPFEAELLRQVYTTHDATQKIKAMLSEISVDAAPSTE